jgi:LysR family glycine cleavage system transcriptional activator
LRAFEAAARHLHFSAAAEELGLTPTAISHQVKQLEEFLGRQLFHRFPRPMRLTAHGEMLFPVIRDGLDRFMETIRGIAGAAAGTLSVSCAHSFAMRWLMPRLARLREETGLDIAIEADDRMVDLHARTVDFAIRYVAAPPLGLAALPLFGDRFVPFAAPALIARHGAPASVRDVVALPLVQWRWKVRRTNAPSWERWLAEAAASDPDCASLKLPPPVVRLSEEAHAIEAAISGQGVALASDVEVSLDLAAGRLVALSAVGIPGLNFYAVHLLGSSRAPDIARFVDWARREAN